MKLTKLIEKNKLKFTSLTTTLAMILLNVKSYATSSIEKQEVITATDNIKQAVIDLAMPIRNCSYVCKYSNYSS